MIILDYLVTPWLFQLVVNLAMENHQRHMMLGTVWTVVTIAFHVFRHARHNPIATP